MKVTIEATSKIVMLQDEGGEIAARIWEGKTERGVDVVLYVTLVMPCVPENDPNHDELMQEFEADLQRVAKPTPVAESIPLRMVL